MRQLTEHHLEDLARGAAILGTGGGGDPYIGKLLARQAIIEHGPVTVVDAAEVPDNAVVVAAAMMGAPTIMVEKLPRGDEIVRAFQALGEYLGTPITHAVPLEAGGINSTLPFVVAANTRLPLVDADGMGRAYPELQMFTGTLYGVSATPMAIADDKGNVAILKTVDNLWTERLARSLTIDMGCAAFIAIYPMTGHQLKEALIPGTLGLCQELGRLARETRQAHGNPAEALARRLGGFPIFSGKVSDVSRRTEGGFARAETKLEGLGADDGATLKLFSQNEYLVAQRDGEVIASTPDLIIALDSETGEPITTESVRYGFRVTVIAAPGDKRWRTPEGLEVVGPRYFGYDTDFVPIEKRISSHQHVAEAKH